MDLPVVAFFMAASHKSPNSLMLLPLRGAGDPGTRLHAGVGVLGQGDAVGGGVLRDGEAAIYGDGAGNVGVLGIDTDGARRFQRYAVFTEPEIFLRGAVEETADIEGVRHVLLPE